MIRRHASLPGLLEQNLFDILGVQVGLGVLSRILGGLDSSLLPQFGFDVLAMLGRHCAEAGDWREKRQTETERFLAAFYETLEELSLEKSQADPEGLVYVVTEVESEG